MTCYSTMHDDEGVNVAKEISEIEKSVGSSPFLLEIMWYIPQSRRAHSSPCYFTTIGMNIIFLFIESHSRYRELRY